FVHRRWLKLAVASSGFYKVTFGQVRNSALFGGVTGYALDSLRLFTWPGLPVMPENSFCDSCDYREVAIGTFDQSQDGKFGGDKSVDNNDYFYFYALGPSDWTNIYDPAQPDTVYLNHPYETHNYYYLTLADSLAPPLPGPPL